MNLEDEVRGFRSPDISQYPELMSYSNNQIYEDFIGCGGLYLTTKMIRHMNLKKGDFILDLGCGLGASSLYLARNFDITVISVDLWNPPNKLSEKAINSELHGRIIPMQIDITKNIPFATKYFDAIFCMNSLFMFGENIEFLKKLLMILKKGGTFCVGSECFNKEPSFSSLSKIPNVYNFEWNWNVWEECYSKYHSPSWWYSRLNDTELIDIYYCEEINDSQILFEDFALNYDSYISEDIRKIGAIIPQQKIIEQIIYGNNYGLYSTLYILAGIKK